MDIPTDIAIGIRIDIRIDILGIIVKNMGKLDYRIRARVPRKTQRKFH